MAQCLDGALPKGFIDLRTAYDSGQSNDRVNVSGVVVGFLPPKSSYGSDFMLTFELRDTSLEGHPTVGVGFKVRLFRRNVDFLPKIENIGDFVILRAVKVSKYAGTPIIACPPDSKQIVIPESALPKPDFKHAFADNKLLKHESYPPGWPPTPEEQVYGIEQRHAVKIANQYTVAKAPREVAKGSDRTAPADRAAARDTAPAQGDHETSRGVYFDKKFGLLKNVADHNFYNLVCEVVKVYASGFGNVEVYVTDYTSNELFFQYAEDPDGTESTASGMPRAGDQYEYLSVPSKQRAWEGPKGKITFQIKLYPPNDTWVLHNCKVGEVYEFRNIHCKHNGSTNLMEGILHGDRRFPDRVEVREIQRRDPRVMDLKERRREMEQLNPPKAAQAAPLTKTQKRAKKKNKNRNQAVTHAANQTVLSATNETSSHNQHVRCGNHSISLSTLYSILKSPHLLNRGPRGVTSTLPFVNQKFRARVRILDFDPPTLEDFAHRLDPTSPYDDYDDDDSEVAMSIEMTSTDRSSNRKKWEWAFRLLVEDAPADTGRTTADALARIPLVVSGADAEHLLQMDATDLRQDRGSLHKLREKLFVMWGNLEEVKAEQRAKLLDGGGGGGEIAGVAGDVYWDVVKNRPFECCVMEYGVRVEQDLEQGAGPEEGWVRMWKLFQTTI